MISGHKHVKMSSVIPFVTMLVIYFWITSKIARVKRNTSRSVMDPPFNNAYSIKEDEAVHFKNPNARCTLTIPTGPHLDLKLPTIANPTSDVKLANYDKEVGQLKLNYKDEIALSVFEIENGNRRSVIGVYHDNTGRNGQVYGTCVW